MNFEKRMNKPIVIVLIALMILCSVVPLMADRAFAFSGKIGSEYYTTDGGRITYAPGDGGYSNSRKTDLNDTIGNRYAYCVQPSKISPVVGKMTVDRVITDEDDTGKWNALRNIVFYSPSYPGYENNVKNIQSEPYYNGTFTHDWAVAHLAMSYVYADKPSDMETFGNTMASGLGEIWTSAKKMGDAMWKSDSSLDDGVPERFKVFISFQENAQDVIVGYMEDPGTLKMKKSSNLTTISDGNGMYDFYGAEYTVYDASGKEAGKLITDSDGISNEIELTEGTYTVKDPETVTISGPESVINSIDHAAAKISLDGISSDKTIRSELILYDSDNNKIDQSRLTNNIGEEGIKVKVQVYPTRDVPIGIDSDQITTPEGYYISDVSYEPTTIEIAAEKARLESIKEIQIPPEAFDLSDVTKKTEVTLDIEKYLPEDTILAAEGSKVVFTFNVTKYGEKTFDYPTGSIVVNDLADDLQLDYGQTDHLEITIKGPMSALEKLTLNKAVSIDLASYTKPGFYQVPVQVKLPDGCSAKEISVSVTLQEKE